MEELKAIETIYKGYKYRSRIEARWAVFFDSMGIKYEYEKEGYELPSGRYLPDFWLPELQYWIEIKGQTATNEEMLKARELCQYSGYNVYIFDDPDIAVYDGSNPFMNNAKAFFESNDGSVIEDEQYIWTQCLICNSLGIHFSGYGNRLACECQETKNSRYDLLELAYINARQARFEFGE